MFHGHATAPLVLSLVVGLGACDCGGGGASEEPPADGATPDGAVPRSHPGPCTIEEDLDVDGAPDNVITLEYDAAGRVVLRAFDEGADGEADAVTSFWYSDGRLVEIAEDNDADGDVDVRTLSEYDGEQLVAIELRDGNGKLLGRTTLSYDADGNLVGEQIDDEADGTADWRARYSHDDGGRVIREEIDEDADGTLDRLIAHRWNGPLLVRTTVDEGANGDADRVTSFDYDGLGNLVLEELDLDADGTVDTVETRSYEGTLLVLLERDVGADGTVERRERFTYDAAGNRLTETVDLDADDAPEEATRFGYECF